MKAKEFVELYHNKFQGYQHQGSKDPIADTVADIVAKLYDEIPVIAQSRHTQSNSAYVAIFREQLQKWRAIVNRVPEIKDLEPVFIQVIQEIMPQVYQSIKQ